MLMKANPLYFFSWDRCPIFLGKVLFVACILQLLSNIAFLLWIHNKENLTVQAEEAKWIAMPCDLALTSAWWDRCRRGLMYWNTPSVCIVARWIYQETNELGQNMIRLLSPEAALQLRHANTLGDANTHDTSVYTQLTTGSLPPPTFIKLSPCFVKNSYRSQPFRLPLPIRA